MRDMWKTGSTCRSSGLSLLVLVVVAGCAEERNEVIDTKSLILELVAGERCCGHSTLLLLQLRKRNHDVQTGQVTTRGQAERTSRIRCSTVSGTESLWMLTVRFWPKR